MTTLVSTIVRGALQLLKATDAAAATPPQDMEDAIIILNRMMNRWEASGLACGWSNVAAPDDDMPSPDEAEEAIIYGLACRLPGYAKPSDFQLVIQQADSFLNDLRRDRAVEMPLTMVSDLPGPEAGGRYNIVTDTPNWRR